MSEEPIAFDSVLDACRNKHRRIVLQTLAEKQQSLTVDDLTEVIPEHDHQTPPTEASEDVLRKIRISLYHVHLPMLAAEGLIHYDPEQQLVEPTEQLDQIQPTLSTILDADPSLNPPMKV